MLRPGLGSESDRSGLIHGLVTGRRQSSPGDSNTQPENHRLEPYTEEALKDTSAPT